MEFALSEQQQMIQQSVDGVLKRACPLERVRRHSLLAPTRLRVAKPARAPPHAVSGSPTPRERLISAPARAPLSGMTGTGTASRVAQSSSTPPVRHPTTSPSVRLSVINSSRPPLVRHCRV